MPLSSEWKDQFSGAVVENERLVIRKEPLLTGPDRLMAKYSLRVRWNDTDLYKHTNYLSYVKFTMDAAQDAVARGHYEGFSGDILQYHVKTIQMLYVAETVANDQLTVFSWQSDANRQEIHFSIQRDNDDTTVYQSCIEFYEMDS